MRRLAKWVEKQTGFKNETKKAKKDRSHERITAIATLDNGTLVEAFKSLNYCQLAKNSLVSKRFWNLIQTNRHRLALLYVDSIRMIQYNTNRSNYGWIKMFDKKFSPKEYSEWVIRNNYSQQIAMKGQYERNFYELTADAYYKDCNDRQWDDTTSVFFTCKELNHENWPVFQHFVRLVTDPFIYIRSLRLTPQNDGLNILAGAFNSDRDRLKCETLIFNLEINSQNVMSWIKGHLVCHKFKIHNYSRSNFDEELVDFFMTGASCTSKISFKYYDLSYVIFDFVQKFMDLKKFDENQIVQSIKSKRSPMVIEVLTRNYAKFIVKEEVDEEKETALTIFHFINNDVGKKMELTLETIGDETNDERIVTANNFINIVFGNHDTLIGAGHFVSQTLRPQGHFVPRETLSRGHFVPRDTSSLVHKKILERSGRLTKFMELKKFDENQIVQSIKSKRSPMVIEVLTRNYAKFIVKEEVDEEAETALTIFEFINSDVGKKMELTLETIGDETNDENMETRFSLKIENL
ncbi:hypothetical protein Ddc_14466 [Ditylenchus destructor]|nr:hypothetical protein Ddc_14466 [Ditylenchus destructor]